MLICFSEEETLVGDPEEFFTAAELSKFQDDAHEYDDKISKYPCRRIYEELVCAFEARAANRILLTSLLELEIFTSCNLNYLLILSLLLSRVNLWLLSLYPCDRRLLVLQGKFLPQINKYHAAPLRRSRNASIDPI